MSRKTKTTDTTSVAGRFSYEGLDRVIHEKARLGILASLAAHTQGLAFNDLKQLCSLTDGNLSRHLVVLTEAGFIKTRRSSRGTRMHTTYRLTATGRRRFIEYIDVLENVVSDAHREAAEEASSKPKASTGWSPA